MNPEIKNRIAKIKFGQVPEGYIKTKMGIVPQEWKLKPISNYLKIVERPIVMDDNAEYELVTVRRGFGGVGSRGFLLGKKILVKSQFAVKEKDFLISKRQIAHGACGIVPRKLDGAIVSNEYNVFTGRDNLDVVFFNYFMQLPELKRLFYLMSNGVHIEKLLFKTHDWLKQKICVPSLAEQQKIATILTIWDKGIDLKQKLITEKKTQKKWLVEKLLTGKKRLTGFSGAWKEFRLKDITEINKNSLTEKTSSDYAFYYLDLSSTDDAEIVYCKNKILFGNAPSRAKRKFEQNDILMSMVRPYLQNFVFVDFDPMEYICSTGFAVIHCSDKVNPQYLFQYIFSASITLQINKIIVGSNYPAINSDDVKELKISLPSLPEQVAIAKILSTADREIKLLEKELIELTQQKKGLMQLLLTGIVKVNGPIIN